MDHGPMRVQSLLPHQESHRRGLSTPRRHWQQQDVCDPQDSWQIWPNVRMQTYDSLVPFNMVALAIEPATQVHVALRQRRAASLTLLPCRAARLVDHRHIRRRHRASSRRRH
eukprot:COSAG04_NODE_201_length_20457_cov_316.186462_13_plen_112_part_00